MHTLVPSVRVALGSGFLAALLSGVTGCSDRAPTSGSEGSESGPVYALMTQVYDQEDRTVYVSLTNTLDPDRISLDEAREFAGVANLAAASGRLLISDGQAPKITEFRVTDDLQWRQGEVLSFLGYSLEDNANLYYHYFLDEHTAYLPFDLRKRVIWDPTDMKIRGTVEDSQLPLEKDGLRLDTGGNRNGVHFAGPVLQPFFYHDEDWLFHGETSEVAVYDPTTHAETKLIELPCPALSMTTQDENGMTYFGTWAYSGALALFNAGPAPCVARVKPDLTLDEAWTTDLTSWTDGRYVNNFRYIGRGKAIGNVLHHEFLDSDFSGPFDPEVDEAIWASGPHWRLWMFDVEAEKAWPVAGIDVEIGSGAQFAVLDGRTFVFLPFEDWSKSKVYELSDDGVASERFEVAGDVFKWIRVR
jgi:hypothetical protein